LFSGFYGDIYGRINEAKNAQNTYGKYYHSNHQLYNCESFFCHSFYLDIKNLFAKFPVFCHLNQIVISTQLELSSSNSSLLFFFNTTICQLIVLKNNISESELIQEKSVILRFLSKESSLAISHSLKFLFLSFSSLILSGAFNSLYLRL